MKITDFLNTEAPKLGQLDNNNKARALIQLVNVEIQANNNFDIQQALTNTVSMVNLMNQSEYLLELMVARHLLEFYRDTNNFNMIVKPFPDTKQDNERYDSIKQNLEAIFKE